MSKSRKFKLTRNLSNIKQLYMRLREVEKIDCSRTLVERISSSGDTTGSPFYHWRWKLHYLADFIAYPLTDEDVVLILRLANEYNVSVTPRGAGSCYYGSGSPTNGGVIIDTKRMKSFQINKEKMTVTVQTGICFSHIMDILDQDDLALGCYPTSAFTTTIGGWIGTGGSMGIGTLQNGPFLDQMISIKVVNPTGELKIYTNKDDFKIFFGTNGIFGIVTEVVLKVYPKPANQIPLMFGFDSMEDLLNSIKLLMEETDPFLIRFSDRYHEINCSGYSKHPLYLFLIYNGANRDLNDDVMSCFSILIKNHGEFLGENYARLTWDDYLKHELKIKLETPVQMLQQINISFDNCEKIIYLFEKLTNERELNHCYYGLINKDKMIRLCLYTPTDNDFWVHFISSKACLHRVVKYAYRIGGRIYTYGLQNTIYLHKFEKDKLKKFQEIKLAADPNYILNPLKIVRSKMNFFRINMMFELTMLWRKLAVKLGIAQKILTVDIPKSEK